MVFLKKTSAKSVSSIFIVLSILLQYGYAELVLHPKDTVVLVGEAVYLNCSTNLTEFGVNWLHNGYSNVVYGSKKLFNPYNTRFRIEGNDSTGVYNLVIPKVESQDAGKYSCVDVEGLGQSSSAELTVLDGGPVCASSVNLSEIVGPNDCGIPPDVVSLSCRVTFHGNEPPRMEWRKVGNSSAMPASCSNAGNMATCTLNINSSLELNGSSYICQTTTQYSCASKAIKISYALNGPDSVLNNTNYDEVTCFANISQSCGYRWRWYEGDHDVTTESEDQVLKPKKPGLHRCEAICTLKNTTCTITAMKINVIIYDSLFYLMATKGNQLAWLAWLVLVLVTIGVALWLKYRHKKGPKQDPSIAPVAEGEKTTIPLLPKDAEEYMDSSKLLKTFSPHKGKAIKPKITGLALLDNKLFVASENSSDLITWDRLTKKRGITLKLKDLQNPEDLVFCQENNCLYVMDWRGETDNKIVKFDSTGTLLNSWSTQGNHGYLSISNDSIVILTDNDTSELIEYSPDGVNIRTIKLGVTKDGRNIVHPRHAVKLVNGNYVVCYGSGKDEEINTAVIDAEGYVSLAYEKPEHRENQNPSNKNFVTPVYLAVDRKGFVMVLDRRSNRSVVLLDSGLRFKKVLIDEETYYGLEYPNRIILDEPAGVMFLAHKDKVLCLRIRKSVA